MVWLIVLIVADLAFVIIGSLLWKKANRFDPASEKDKVKFFIQNQLGTIISIIAFLPLVILIFTNKNMDGKQKGIVGAIAVVAMLIAGITSYDFNPRRQRNSMRRRSKRLNR
jgi:Na+/proline symporter